LQSKSSRVRLLVDLSLISTAHARFYTRPRPIRLLGSNRPDASPLRSHPVPPSSNFLPAQPLSAGLSISRTCARLLVMLRSSSRLRPLRPLRRLCPSKPSRRRRPSPKSGVFSPAERSTNPRTKASPRSSESSSQSQRQSLITIVSASQTSHREGAYSSQPTSSSTLLLRLSKNPSYLPGRSSPRLQARRDNQADVDLRYSTSRTPPMMFLSLRLSLPAQPSPLRGRLSVLSDPMFTLSTRSSPTVHRAPLPRPAMVGYGRQSLAQLAIARPSKARVRSSLLSWVPRVCRSERASRVYSASL
jgi:hypothetical protein